ncbi:MAG: hypothetical protein LUE92_07720 [Clostridiales bacterium]|nr:hypothetical protein [Clostridiales bacterium]
MLEIIYITVVNVLAIIKEIRNLLKQSKTIAVVPRTNMQVRHDVPEAIFMETLLSGGKSSVCGVRAPPPG